MLNGLDLFSGIGGISAALRPWVRPIAYCEKDKSVREILLSRQAAGEIECAPIWDDVRTLRASDLPSFLPVDIIYGGFPCQDISCAGLGAGLEGKRSGLVFEIFRLVDELQPPFIFLENVPAIRSRGAERVGKELARRGYDSRWTIVSAQEVGAPHIRKRWFCLAYANSYRFQGLPESDRQSLARGKVQSGDDPYRFRHALSDADGKSVWDFQQRRPRRRTGRVPLEGEDVPGFYGRKEYVAYAESVQSLSGSERTGAYDFRYPGTRSIPEQSEVLAHASGLRKREQTDEADSVSARRKARDESCDGGPHLAQPPSVRRREGRTESAREQGRLGSPGGGPPMGDADGAGLEVWEGFDGNAFQKCPSPVRADWWAIEPPIRRVAHGVPDRVDRLSALGNAVVPRQARTAFERLSGIRREDFY